jgi:hypothetical protein
MDNASILIASVVVHTLSLAARIEIGAILSLLGIYVGIVQSVGSYMRIKPLANEETEDEETEETEEAETEEAEEAKETEEAETEEAEAEEDDYKDLPPLIPFTELDYSTMPLLAPPLVGMLSNDTLPSFKEIHDSYVLYQLRQVEEETRQRNWEKRNTNQSVSLTEDYSGELPSA